MDGDGSGTGIKCVSVNEPYFQGSEGGLDEPSAAAASPLR